MSAQAPDRLVVTLALLPNSHMTSGRPFSLSKLWALPPLWRKMLPTCRWLFISTWHTVSTQVLTPLLIPIWECL